MAERLLHGRLFFTVQTLIKIEIFRSRPLHRRSIHAEFKPLHRLNEVSKWRSVSFTDAFVHCPDFGSKSKFFRSRPLHRRSIHAEFKPLHRLNEVSKSRPLHRRSIHAEFKPLHSDEAHFWLNGYVNKQNCRIWSEANPQVYVETPLHPEKLTVWCALWAGGILLQKR
ncbi:hypothetical protein TNCV_3608291 [Trichonephila clavipes]|nr:hypothetical protein TNCV_3608291 [Trichonephila clavipes]